MSTWNCSYTRTLNGTCEQQKSRGRDVCFYHAKVLDRHINDVDEQAVLRDMPSIILP